MVEIKNYFLNYQFRMNHLEIDHRNSIVNTPTTLGQNNQQEKWRVRILDTGTESMTGARIARALDIISAEYLEGCYQLGQIYPDLCSSIFLMCEKG